MFDPGQMAIMTLALAAGAVVKGATGMGLPLVALPVLATTLGLHHAVGLLSCTMVLTNGWQVWTFRAAAHDAGLAFLPRFLLAGGAGVLLGTWLLQALPERVLIAALGGLLLAYFGLKLARPHWRVGARGARIFSLPAGLGSGLLQGATGISAPIGVSFIHAMGLERATLVFAVSTMFLALGLVQMPALILTGIMQPPWLLQALVAMVPILCFMPLGQALAARLSRAAFDRLILIFLGLMGVKMLLGL